MINKCPKCGSEDIEEMAGFISCNKCGYDESNEFEEGRSTQKGKTGFTPYKKGGGHRTKL